MADKKLNEVTKVTDMAYVPVIMADGSIGQIAKADLASVVAGLIPNASLTEAGKMSSNLYANASFFGMSTGSPGTNKLYRTASIKTGYISKASIMVAGQYTNPVTFEIICGDGKVIKIGNPTSSYVKIYKDNNYAYIWLSSSLGDYSRGGVYFNTVNASLVKFEDVTSSIDVSNLTEI